MPLSKEELMQPRYKVIADYPGSPFELNKIYTYWIVGGSKGLLDEKAHGSAVDAEQYPGIFRRLEWWEERAIADLPEFMADDAGSIRRVKEVRGCLVACFDYPGEVDYIESVPEERRQQGYELYCLDDLLPADESEYNEYTQRQQTSPLHL